WPSCQGPCFSASADASRTWRQGSASRRRTHGTTSSSGGLMSYGPNISDLFRSAAPYVDKILRGAMPGDLPVEQPTNFQLIINLKAARGLGLIPQWSSDGRTISLRNE